ncbi:hypothetical protein ACFX2I_024798 [Malus domestica]
MAGKKTPRNGVMEFKFQNDLPRNFQVWEMRKAKDNFLVPTGAHLIEAPYLEKWKIIGGGFFQHMPTLRVFDLSENKGVTHLPLGISKLKSVQYFCLSQTGIRRLPVELKALDKLKYLNL